MIRARRPPRRRTGSGQALVELALVLPLLLLLFMGLVDFGRAVFAYNSVSEAARNGARVAIVNQTLNDICTVVAERAPGLGLPTACAPDASAVGVWVTPTTALGKGCNAINCLQSVKVTYRFEPLTPIIGRLLGPFFVSSTSTVPIESVCFNNNCPRT